MKAAEIHRTTGHQDGPGATLFWPTVPVVCRDSTPAIEPARTTVTVHDGQNIHIFVYGFRSCSGLVREEMFSG